MSEEGRTIRLSKVAKELNIGLHTITEFLNKKGFKVENKPTTKISDEMHDVLLDEFHEDKDLREKSEKISIGNVEREEVGMEEASRARKKAQEKDGEEILIKNVTVSHLTNEKPAEREKPKSNVKVIGKIELDGGKKKREEEKAAADAKKAKEEAEAAEALAKEEAKKAAAEAKKTKKTEANSEPKKATKKETKAEEADKVEEVKAEDATETPTEKALDAAPDAPKEEEPSKVIRGSANRLSGPSIIGKIVLPEKKPVASSSAKKDTEDDNKRKRKRKRKPMPGDSRSTPGAGNTSERSAPGARGKKREEKADVTDKEIQDQIKATLARLSGGGKAGKFAKRSKLRKQKRDDIAATEEERLKLQEQDSNKIKLTEYVSVSELAKLLSINPTDVISACMSLGIMASINQRLDAETLSIIAEEFGYEVEFVSAEVQEAINIEEEDTGVQIPRPPIVTVMGHVDHGKTSLLDYIRSANVIAGEAGGITQHIGAYEVTLENGKQITFLDTPGHEAFTAMRARGAKVTDLCIIVVAADDTVMPQTIEAINHAQAAGVPMVFAINKIDKDGANPEKIKERLAEMNLLVEDWGGKFQSQDVSAKSGLNVDQLLEKVLLEAEILELTANPDKRAIGTVVEASMEKGKGLVTTILVQSGTLHIGDPILVGCYSGKVKAMFNERGGQVQSAGPSTPVQVLGVNGSPQAGDTFNAMESEQDAKEVANKRLQLQREQGIRTQKHITLEEIGRRLAIGNFKELNVIVKGDVDGSVEALSDAIIKLSTEEIQLNVIHKSVGQISESDVLLASASDAIIVGFQVRPSPSARKLAEKEQIDIRLYSIIYAAIEELKAAMEGMLSPEIKEEILGNAEIREVFKVSKVGTVSGSMVLDGKLRRDSKVRIVRDGVVVYTGEIDTLRRFKDDIKEVATGYECGITIKNFNDVKVGDIIEAYHEVEIQRKLS